VYSLLLAAAAAAPATLPPTATAGTLAVYDPFPGPAIDDSRWRGFEEQASQAAGLANLEAIRRTTGGKLQLALTTRGGTSSDDGNTGDGRNSLRVNHAALADLDPRIRVLQSQVTILDAHAEDCAANTTGGGRARAQLLMFLFNDGTGSGAAGDFTGDILAGISLERHAVLGDRIVAFVNRCDVPNCAFSQNLSALVFDRPWELNVPEVVTVRWQPASDQVLFTVNNGAGPEQHALEYTQDDGAPPQLFLNDLRVANTVENCTAGPVRASIDARFDRVKLNGNAVLATQ
jgi:hypothetical protein